MLYMEDRYTLIVYLSERGIQAMLNHLYVILLKRDMISMVGNSVRTKVWVSFKNMSIKPCYSLYPNLCDILSFLVSPNRPQVSIVFLFMLRARQTSSHKLGQRQYNILLKLKQNYPTYVVDLLSRERIEW